MKKFKLQEKSCGRLMRN